MDFIDRLKQEREELKFKTYKLGAFLASERKNQIDPNQKVLLFMQYEVMKIYLQILDRRLELLGCVEE